jgi:hypothetical protein
MEHSSAHPSMTTAVNPKPDVDTVIRFLPKWFEHYNQLHPHRALGYHSPFEFITTGWKPHITLRSNLTGLRKRGYRG